MLKALCDVMGASCDVATRERAVGVIMLISILLLTKCLSSRCGSFKPAKKLISFCVVAMVAVSLFGSGAIMVPIMVTLLPLFWCCPGLWYYLANSLWCPMWGLCILYTEVFGGLEIVLYGDVPTPGETLLITPNHLSELDWIVVLGLAARCDALAGVRFIMKASLAKLPIIGWGLALHHSVFIRSRPEGRAAQVSVAERAATVTADKDDIVNTVSSLTTHHKAHCCWIVIYTEGTRIIPEQHARALDFAREHARPAYQYLLQPRAKGLAAVLQGGRPRLTHALDLTVAYEGFSAACERNSRPAGLMDGLVREQVAHVLIRRVAIPDDDDGVQGWLDGLWAEKERALARWEHDGSFEAERLDMPLPARPLLVSLLLYAVIAALCASGLVLAGIELYHLAMGSSE
mgnify:CR=1 FL=1